MSTALYRKWRSQNFEEVIGQEHVTGTLRNALRDGRVAHAYLFTGPRGTGKTSIARILAKALNCTAPEDQRPCNLCPTCVAITEGRMIDLIEIDAASNNSVDDIRELRERVGFRPSEGRYRIYIIDEVHMLSNSAFNALLKTLEEPPPHARFILATTDPHKIPATVLSRCQRFDFRRIPAPEIASHLKHIANAEGFQAEPDALLAIARSAQGCMRDAVSMLDQMLSYGGDTVTLAQVQQVLGAVNAQVVAELVDALAAKNTGRGLALIHKLVTDGASLTEFCQQVLEYLRGVMVLQMTGDATLLDDLAGEEIRQLQQQAKALQLPNTLFALKRFSEAIPELKGGYQPQLPLELAFIEAVQGGPVAPVVVQQVVQQVVQAAGTAAPLPAVASASPAKDAKPSTPDEQTGARRTTPRTLDNAGADLLRRRWQEFLRAVKQACGPKVEGSLRSGVKGMVVGEDVVALAFSEQYAFARDMVDTVEMRDKISRVFTQFLGRSVNLLVQTGEQAVLPNAISVLDDTDGKTGPDPLVEFAVNDLGAKVVDKP